jgi:virulence-associated protein VagC
MADRAKLFKSGGSQAVRLPKEYRFHDAKEVLIYRQGRRVILEPLKPRWSRRFLALAGSARDFPYPDAPPAAEPGPPKDINAIFREGSLIDKAIRKAARLAWLAHKREGLPIPIWKDGKTVWIPPEEIEVPDDEPD